jgi:putative transposase
VHHSDQGSTYANEDYLDQLAAHDITCSMSRRGNCLDNAVAESLFVAIERREGREAASSGERV